MGEGDPRPDPYEQKYMEGGEALVRSRKPMPWWWHLGFGAVAAGAVAAAVGDGSFAPLVALPVLGLAFLLFSHLRLVVTKTHVHVQYGLFGPRIPVDRIERVAAEDYAPLRYGGWGIKVGVDRSMAFSVPGGTGRGVRIEWVNAKGKKRAVFVSSDRAEEVVAAIQRARGVRVEAEPEAVPVEVPAVQSREEGGGA